MLQKESMFYLKRSDRSQTTNPVEIRRMAADFYLELYGSDVDSIKLLSNNLPRLSPENKDASEEEFNFLEFSEAVWQLSTGQVPGLDGLPAEFYKHFWGTIGRDYGDVICERGFTK